jgi:hypothetical protein
MVAGCLLLVAGCWLRVTCYWLVISIKPGSGVVPLCLLPSIKEIMYHQRGVGGLEQQTSWLLVTGCWLLGAGYWVLVTGYWLLVAGFGAAVVHCLTAAPQVASRFKVTLLITAYWKMHEIPHFTVFRSE